MIQAIIRYMQGYVKIRVRGYSPERFLNLCCFHQIYIWGLTPCDNAYEMYMTLKGFRKLRPLVRKTRSKVVLVRRYGLPFFIYRHRKRKVFFISVILCLGLLWGYSGYIWDIHFEGNEKWTNQTLLEFLSSREVAPGMRKSQVDCAQIVKDIRREYDDIVWVSASIDGSRLRIQIKENEDVKQPEDGAQEDGTQEDDTQEDGTQEDGTQEKDVREEIPQDLIAAEDGVITQMITRSGIPQVHVGDTVKKGDVLVSGRIEVLNDAAEVVGYQYQQSDADIFADTQMEYRDSMPLTYQEKQYEKKRQRRVWKLRIGAYLFSFGWDKNQFEHWETYTSEHQLKLGENFYLPVAYGSVLLKSYETTEKKYTEKQIQEKLTQNFIHFSEELEEKGIQIHENSVKIHLYEKSAAAEGTLFLNQRITEPADTEILDVERKEQDESIGTDDGDTGGA